MSTRTTRTSGTRRRSDSGRVVSELPVKPVSKVTSIRTFVLYGRSGTGKTTLSATFPKPLLLLDVKDRGTDSIADVEGVDVMEVRSSDDMDMAYWYLKKNPTKYKTIVIDTVSQLQSIVVSEVAASKKKDTSGNWGTLAKRDWADIAAKMKELLINFRDLGEEGMEVVFIAQDRAFNFEEEEDENSETLAPEIGPALSPSIAKTLNAAVSVIGNTFIRTKEVVKKIGGKEKVSTRYQYCLRVGPSPVYVTKLRKPRDFESPSFIVNPTYEDIVGIIEGE